MKREKRIARTYFSPARLFAVIALSIFVTEALVMGFLYIFPLPQLASALLDPLALVALISPVLYFFLFRPILLHVTERKKVEEELTKERDKAQTFLDIAEVIMVVLDKGGSVELINKKGCSVLGLSEGEVLGKRWFDELVSPETWGVVKDAFSGIIAGNLPSTGSFENPITTKSGEQRDIIWHYAPIIENRGITGILYSGEDITERKRAEKALIDSETHYRLVHNASFDGIIVSNAEDRIVDSNPSAEKIFGYGLGGLSGLDVVDVMPEKYRKRHEEGLKRFLSTGTSHIQGKVLELEGQRMNGEVFPIELILSSFSVEGVVNFTGTIRDITERKKAEKERELIQAELNQTQKIEAVGRLAGGIAHDFNNILTSIRGNAELALEDMKSDDPALERLREINASVMHASKLTRQLLLFSRSHKFEAVPININSAVENILTMLKRLIGEDITIATDMEPGAWIIEADEGSIEQVVLNLSVNARDAMPEGGRVTIGTKNIFLDEEACRELRDCTAGNYVCLSFSDTGKGMDEEILSRIFEPFFTTKAPGKGTGLGLSVVYGIVKKHKGCLSVSSVAGEGTEFRLFFPASEAGVRPLSRPPVASAFVVRGDNERILLVEDDEEVRKVAKEALIENGYAVTDVASAEDALYARETAEQGFHLVFTDIKLPGMNGVEMIKAMLSRPGPGRTPLKLKAVFTSSYTDALSRWPDIKTLGFTFLPKPYAFKDLLTVIKAALSDGVD